MAERRKRTKNTGDKGKPSPRNPRPRKGRAASRKTQGPERGPVRGGPDGPPGRTGAAGESVPSVAAGTTEPGPAPSPLLPGELYERSGRWWWRVKLPGEDRAKARALEEFPRPQNGTVESGPEAASGTDGRVHAEKIAFAIWEQAVQENAARQTRLESTEKIERLKAQFLDKVRHFTELVETANAKLEAEAQARAEAEEKLRQLSAVPRAAFEPKPAAMRMEEDKTLPQVGTGVCGCCGVTGIALTHLSRIDSGQLLCPRCLTALRADIARLDANAGDAASRNE